MNLNDFYLEDYFDWVPEADDIKANFPQMPEEKYSVILMNTPWDFVGGIQYDSAFDEEVNGKINRSFWYHDTFTNQAKKIAKIRDMKIHDICEDDCLLFMWTTGPKFLETVQLAVHWGFEFQNVAFVYDNMIQNRGNYSRVNYSLTQCEFCLVFKKGNRLDQKVRNIKQLMFPNETPLHNNHPTEVIRSLTSMFPNEKKIEMFGDQRFGGWDIWNIRYKP